MTLAHVEAAKNTKSAAARQTSKGFNAPGMADGRKPENTRLA
jgi:hypothetical protein